MSLPKSTAAYQDIIPILDTVMRYERFPASFPCSSPSAAAHWRMRAYSLRALIRRQEEETYNLPRGMGTSLYDPLRFTLDGSTVIINRYSTEPVSQLVIDGEPVEVRANHELSTLGAPDDSDPSPDRLAFESRKYSNRGLWLLLLPSGEIAVADATRQLVAVLRPERLDRLLPLLAEADAAPPTRPELPAQSAPLDPELDDLDLRI